MTSPFQIFWWVRDNFVARCCIIVFSLEKYNLTGLCYEQTATARNQEKTSFSESHNASTFQEVAASLHILVSTTKPCKNDNLSHQSRYSNSKSYEATKTRTKSTLIFYAFMHFSLPYLIVQWISRQIETFASQSWIENRVDKLDAFRVAPREWKMSKSEGKWKIN